MKNINIKLALVALITSLFTISNVSATQTDIVGPVGSSSFGQHVAALSNGNIVITDPYYDAPGPIVNVGAVYLYNGTTGALISTLTGSQAHDAIGFGGVTTLTNGNYVIKSPFWNNPSPLITEVGAVTWCSGTSGCSGTISLDNSLIGSTADDSIGSNGILPLSNGNYLVISPVWDNQSPSITDVGAVTWGNGSSGTFGVVSPSNSLIGGTTYDRIGEGGITRLTNGNYVVRSPFWDNLSLAPGNNVGAATWGNGTSGTIGIVSASNSLIGGTTGDNVGFTNIVALSNGNYVVNSKNWNNPALGISSLFAGASTWGNGTIGTVGLVSANNSLVGTKMNDNVGRNGITELTNGNYVVISSTWGSPSPSTDINLGAATWCNGAGGTVGVISTSNSLIGGTSGDNVGGSGVIALSNGNYVVNSKNWDNQSPLTKDVGAVTWGNGAGGIVGVVSASNSLIGTTAGDNVGSISVGLTNGNYVVSSSNWDHPSLAIANVGAVTWGNGSSGTIGIVSPNNSLIGGKVDDFVGAGLTALTNGNYVVGSRNWDNPSSLIANVGAATWCTGWGETVGIVSPSNSLIGSMADDLVGDSIALTNGNYVVHSLSWDNPSAGANSNSGAITWGNGLSGTVGVISASNSLVGGSPNDNVGSSEIMVLKNGNYVVNSPNWDNPSPLITNVGAITWGNGMGGTVGLVSANNSLVGGTSNDQIGNIGSFGTILTLTNGSYIVTSRFWDNPTGSAADAGAISYGSGVGGTVGFLTVNNSVRGSTVNAGGSLNYSFDPVNNLLVVGRPVDNIVTLFKTTSPPKSRKRIRFI